MIRYLLIGLLIYLAVRAVSRVLFRGFLKGSAERFFEAARGENPKGAKGTKQGKGQELLVEDPVCKVLVPKDQALAFIGPKGKQFYFCSNKCLQEYQDRASRSA